MLCKVMTQQRMGIAVMHGRAKSIVFVNLLHATATMTTSLDKRCDGKLLPLHIMQGAFLAHCVKHKCRGSHYLLHACLGTLVNHKPQTAEAEQPAAPCQR